MSFVDYMSAGAISLLVLLIVKLIVRGFVSDDDRTDWDDFWMLFLAQAIAIIIMVAVLTIRY